MSSWILLYLKNTEVMVIPDGFHTLCENHQVIVMKGTEVCECMCLCVRGNCVLTYLRRHRFPVVQPPKHLPTSISCGKLATQTKAH